MLERCTHPKLGKDRLMEAEALLFMFNALQSTRWYPYTAVYTPSGGKFSWFLKARATRSPDRLAIVTGMGSWEAVQAGFLAKYQAITDSAYYGVFRRGQSSYSEAMSLS
jgi:hypothetical protein